MQDTWTPFAVRFESLAYVLLRPLCVEHLSEFPPRAAREAQTAGPRFGEDRTPAQRRTTSAWRTGVGDRKRNTVGFGSMAQEEKQAPMDRYSHLRASMVSVYWYGTDRPSVF